MAVRRDPQGPQVLHERLGVPELELRRRRFPCSK
jgi:hypothetical protein